jgi:hypothetical protein
MWFLAHSIQYILFLNIGIVLLSAHYAFGSFKCTSCDEYTYSLQKSNVVDLVRI